MTATLLVAAAVAATNCATIVVEASRTDARQMDMPSAVHLIGADEIRASGARDVADLLAKRTPEIHLRHLGGGNPALAEISMRGYGETGHGRTLVVVDGERLNAPDLVTPNLSRIALNSVSRLEVLAGPQTVLFGDGASAGVLNVVTEPQSDERKTYAEVHGGSWGTVGGAAGTRGGVEEDGIRYWADGSWERSDGYRSQSGYNLWNLNGGLRKTWENGTYLRVSSFYSDAQYDLPGALSYDEWKADPRQSHASEDRYRRAAYGFNATFNARLDDENELRLTGTFSERRMWAYQQGTDWFSDNDYDIHSTRALAEWLNDADLLGFENEAVLGLQYAYDTLGGTMASGYGTQYPDYNRQTMDVFAQDTFRFIDELALQLGGRYARVWAFNNLCEKSHRNDHLGAAEAALIWNPVEDAKIYAKVSRLYRNPFLDETPGRFDAGYNWVNTRLLGPERGWNAELGFDWKIDDELALGADVYSTWLEDEIFYDALAHDNVNAEDGTVRRGIDAHVAWEREKLASVSLAASFVQATFDGGKYGRNRIPLVPEATVSVNGRVWLWDDCDVFGGYRFQSDMVSCSDFGNDFADIGWSGVFHVGVAYEPTFADWCRGFRLAVTVDNLFDERYCDYVTYGENYYPAAGRSFTVSLRYEF